jgi:hypothetical protein
MRRADDPSPPSAAGEFSKEHDVRLRPNWKAGETMDVYSRATAPEDKTTKS